LTLTQECLTLKPVLSRGLIAALLLAVPFTAQAHRSWMLPSATVLSGQDPWVTVDAAISNDLFYFEHHPMQLEGIVITAPDGTQVKPENSATGRYRSTFDVQLKQQGTYRISSVRGGLNASYKVDGQTKRWRGTAASFAKEVPQNAADLRVTQSQGRIDVFATLGKPTTTALTPTGTGLELAAVTHPTDLFAGEEASFKLLLDGKPAADVEVTVIPGGIRYRDNLNEMKVRTDKEGTFSVTWPEPGMYWINASVRDNKATVANASRNASYTATLEAQRP
jgi:uncharacterized GH25 family protein